MHFDEEEISRMEILLENGESASSWIYCNCKRTQFTTVFFVDITANETVSQTYEHYLKQNVAVVTCNKINVHLITKIIKKPKNFIDD
jgi:aspartokinase/homoserine dehydrogenase 1